MGKKKASQTQPDLSESATATALLGDPPPNPAPVKKSRKFQAFTRMLAKRSSLSFPENNPRSIDPHAFKKLREFVKREGLLGSLIVNRRTEANGWAPVHVGRLVIVGGNQRTRAMDEISSYAPPTPAGPAENDYEIPIDVIEVPQAREAEIIVALNNVGLQGTYDWDALAELMQTPGVNPLATGFDRVELATFMDEGALEQLLGPAAARQAAAEAPILDELAAIAEVGREQDRADRQAANAQESSVADPANPSEPTEAEAAGEQSAVDGMKERRAQYQETINRDTNAANFMIVLVGDSDAECREFLTRLNLPPGQEFYSLAAVKERMGI